MGTWVFGNSHIGRFAQGRSKSSRARVGRRPHGAEALRLAPVGRPALWPGVAPLVALRHIYRDLDLEPLKACATPSKRFGVDIRQVESGPL